MVPVLFKIGPVAIHSFGLMLAVAFIVCSYYLGKDAARFGFKKEIVYDLVFWLVVSGLGGARLFYILLNMDYYREYPIDMIKIFQGGLAWQGGLATAIAAFVVFVKKHRMPMAKTFDFFAPYAALGQSIGRIGCFLNGCCYGRHFDGGIYCPVHSDTLYPTQLFDSAGLLVIFLILKSYAKVAKKDGAVAVAYIVLASSLRFVVEFFRGDHSGTWLGLSIFQVNSLVLIFIAVIISTRLKHKPS